MGGRSQTPMERVVSGLAPGWWCYNRPLAMRRAAIPILVWTCLLAFGLGSTALRSGLVLCSDVHGGSRLEWGCLKTGEGECLPASSAHAGEAASEDDPCGPHPCEDTPLRGDNTTAQVAPRTDVLPALVLPLLAARLEIGAIQIPCGRRSGMRLLLAHPPDTGVRLRSVILLV